MTHLQQSASPERLQFFPQPPKKENKKNSGEENAWCSCVYEGPASAIWGVGVCQLGQGGEGSRSSPASAIVGRCPTEEKKCSELVVERGGREEGQVERDDGKRKG